MKTESVMGCAKHKVFTVIDHVMRLENFYKSTDSSFGSLRCVKALKISGVCGPRKCLPWPSTPPCHVILLGPFGASQKVFLDSSNVFCFLLVSSVLGGGVKIHQTVVYK